jgi:hypothetical protein
MLEEIRPGQRLEVPSKFEWEDGRELNDLMVKAGFNQSRVEVYELPVWFEADNAKDLANRVVVAPVGLAKAQGWSEEDIGRMEDVLARHLKDVVSEFDGKVRVTMVAWVAKCRK